MKYLVKQVYIKYPNTNIKYPLYEAKYDTYLY